MTPDRIEAWQNYFAGQLRERCDLAEHQAWELATQWMESLVESKGPELLGQDFAAAAPYGTERGGRRERNPSRYV